MMNEGAELLEPVDTEAARLAASIARIGEAVRPLLAHGIDARAEISAFRAELLNEAEAERRRHVNEMYLKFGVAPEIALDQFATRLLDEIDRALD